MKDNCLVDINPDGMDINDLRELIIGLRELSYYCNLKHMAMESRLAGEINDAMVFEKECDNQYKKLPKCVKSW